MTYSFECSSGTRFYKARGTDTVLIIIQTHPIQASRYTRATRRPSICVRSLTRTLFTFSHVRFSITGICIDVTKPSSEVFVWSWVATNGIVTIANLLSHVYLCRKSNNARIFCAPRCLAEYINVNYICEKTSSKILEITGKMAFHCCLLWID
jgi:hypothetical protein